MPVPIALGGFDEKAAAAYLYKPKKKKKNKKKNEGGKKKVVWGGVQASGEGSRTWWGEGRGHCVGRGSLAILNTMDSLNT